MPILQRPFPYVLIIQRLSRTVVVVLARGHATVTAALLFALCGSVACGADGHVVFSQPNVSDISKRIYVIERRPLGEWFMISGQMSPFTADGKFVPVDWDPGDDPLAWFHLNAETHFQTAPAELGWSMRNLRIDATTSGFSSGSIRQVRSQITRIQYKE